jgi:hypothetical protein
MKINNIIYNGIRTISIVSILTVLTIGFILPISFVQALVVNPLILVSLMVIFAMSNEKLQSITNVTALTHLPDNSKNYLCVE